jgi:hypothetical protein
MIEITTDRGKPSVCDNPATQAGPHYRAAYVRQPDGKWRLHPELEALGDELHQIEEEAVAAVAEKAAVNERYLANLRGRIVDAALDVAGNGGASVAFAVGAWLESEAGAPYAPRREAEAGPLRAALRDLSSRLQ